MGLIVPPSSSTRPVQIARTTLPVVIPLSTSIRFAPVVPMRKAARIVSVEVTSRQVSVAVTGIEVSVSVSISVPKVPPVSPKRWRTSISYWSSPPVRVAWILRAMLSEMTMFTAREACPFVNRFLLSCCALARLHFNHFAEEMTFVVSLYGFGGSFLSNKFLQVSSCQL